MSDSPKGQAAAPSSTLAWRVWRMDDNGNAFLVRDDVAGREEAERIVAEFTARGHKQVYWTEPQRAAQGGR